MPSNWKENERPGQRTRHRDIDRAALFAFVPVVAIAPVWFLALFLFWLPLSLVTDIQFWQIIVGHLAAGLLLFIPSFQRRVLTSMMGARKPTAGEAPKLQKAFNEVTQAWHLRKRHFVVGVVDDKDLNAFASGGHLVIVTSFAVKELNHDELCGVLAHELCHHLGSHTIALTFGQWLTLPVYLLARVGSFLHNVSRAATHAFARSSLAAQLLGQTISLFFDIFSRIFGSGYAATRYLGNVVGKSAEFQADQRVVRLGYGRQLAAALRKTAPTISPSNSHPPARTRIARIEASLRPSHWRHPSTRINQTGSK